MSHGQDSGFSSWAEEADVNGLPQVILPGAGVTICECARRLFGLIAPTRSLFLRGGVPVRLINRDDGTLALELLLPVAARSYFEQFGRLLAWRTGRQGDLVLKPVSCPLDMADALLHADVARDLLPSVRGLVNCPVLREINGQLQVAGQGYDQETGLIVTGGAVPDTVPLKQAIESLSALLSEFEFQTKGDHARSIASLITPALKFGGFIKGRVPADVAEADQSQSGKTYRQKLIAAIYNEKVSLVASREGGVGSVDESFDQQLLSGRPFIQFDNFRGRFDSARLEAFLTAEGSFSCRVPHRGEVCVQPENYFIFLTSNGVDTTRDFANRSNIIRIRKKAAGFAYKVFPEGDLLAHVRVHQSFYLGCVFAVIREWYAQGKPRSEETGHDFREWVQMVDWIAQGILQTVPIMEGHRQAQERVSNPDAVWLRKVVIAIVDSGSLDKPIIASEIYELCVGQDIEIPGLRSGADEDKGKKVIGSVMSRLFKDQNAFEVDSFQMTREERYLPRDNSSDGGSFKSKTYTVTRP